MTIDDAASDAAVASRRSLHATAGAVALDAPGQNTPARGTPALGWLSTDAVTAAAPAPSSPEAADLLAAERVPGAVRPATVLPITLVALVVVAYVTATLLWPLHAVRPELAAVQVQPASAPAATPVWPGTGTASVGVDGIGGPLSSATDIASIASITKVVTALLILDELPLALGEQGPSYSFTYADQNEYWQYIYGGQSALQVPVGGSLTEYQLLQGILIGSANNYADRLASTIWPTDEVFAAAATAYLAAHGLTGITIADPSGFDPRNTSDAGSLVPLARKALANPVIAEIVAIPAVELPGAGLVQNTNQLLADPGVVGVKTGTLDTYTLLAVKDITVGETPVRLYATVLAQPTSDERFAATRDLFAQLESEVQEVTAVTAGTTAGRVTTAWGETVDVIAAGDAAVVLWNEATPVVTIDLNLGDKVEKGDAAGTLTVTGPLDSRSVELRLADDVEGPSPWWRITHPVELFGLDR